MNKKELKQEAEEWLCNNLHSTSEEDFIKAMIDIAEPREKRIAELEAHITDMKNYCCEVSKYLHDYSGVELNSPECRKRDILLIKELKLCEKWGDLR